MNLKEIKVGTSRVIGLANPTEGASGASWILSIVSGIPRFYYNNINDIGMVIVGVSTLSANIWYHIVVTCDAGSPTNNLRLFVNGSLEKTETILVTPKIDATTTQITIGQYNSGDSFNGYLANTRLVRGAALYTTTFTPPTAPLGPATSGTTVLLLRAAKFQRTPLQLTSDGRLSVSKITAADTSISSQAYPPAAFTGHVTNITTSTYGKGYYIVSASSEYSASYQGWRLFDRTGTQWASSTTYNASAPYSHNGTITTIDTNGINYSGEWAQIQLPLSISLTAYTITGSVDSTKFPARFYILGSINGVNWTLVSQQSAIPYSASPQLFTVNTTRAFTYYRIVVNQITGNGTVVDFSEWLLYGKPEALNITADGRIGVGVVNPTQALEVAGNAVFGGNISAGNMGMFRNRIINGDMRIAQRGTSLVTSTGTNTTYGSVDRFGVAYSITTGGLTHAQLNLSDTDIPYQYGFKNSFRLTASTACTSYSYIFALHVIEGLNISDLNWGKPYGVGVSISFWLRTNSAAGGYTVLTLRNANAGGSQNTINFDIKINSQSQWQYVTIQVPPPPITTTWNINNSAGIEIFIGSYSTYRTANIGGWVVNNSFIGTTNTTNIWATLNNYIEFTGVQLEKGTLATPFEFRPYPIELQLCQRYYYQVNSLSNGYAVLCQGSFIGSTTIAQCLLNFPVTMRTWTLVSNFSASAVSTFWFGSGSGATCTGVAIVGGAQNTNGAQIQFTTSSAVTAGSGCIIEAANTTAAFLGFSAEL